MGIYNNHCKKITRKEEIIMYTVIETKVMVDEKEGVTYGIRHDDGTVKNDVSPNREEAERLAAYFNEHNLAPYQLDDVIADMSDSNQGYDI